MLDFETRGPRVARAWRSCSTSLIQGAAALRARSSSSGSPCPGPSASIAGRRRVGRWSCSGYPVLCEVTDAGAVARARWRSVSGSSPSRAPRRRLGTPSSAPRSASSTSSSRPAGSVRVVSSLLSPRSQRLGDLVAGTMVLRERSRHARADGGVVQPAGRAGGATPTTSTSRASPTRSSRVIRSFLLRVHELAPEARGGDGAPARRRPIADGDAPPAAARRAPRAVPRVPWPPPTSAATLRHRPRRAAGSPARPAGVRPPPWAPPPPAAATASAARRRLRRAASASAAAPPPPAAAPTDRPAAGRRPARTTPPLGPLEMRTALMPALALPRPRGHARRCGPRRVAAMVAGARRGLRQPVRRPRAGARGPRAALDDARAELAEVVGLPARRGRVHQRRHRGRQPRGRAGSSARAAARRCAPRSSTRPCSSPSRASGGRVVPVDRPGRRRPRCPRERSSTTTVTLVSVDAREQRGRHRPAARRDRGGRARRVRPRAVLHTDAAQALTLARRPRRPPRAADLDHAGVAQVRRPGRRRCAGGARAVWPSRRSRSVAGRSASGAAARRTSPARSAFAAAAVAPPTRPARALVDRSRRLARRARRRPSPTAVPGHRRERRARRVRPATTSSPASPTCACRRSTARRCCSSSSTTTGCWPARRRAARAAPRSRRTCWRRSGIDRALAAGSLRLSLGLVHHRGRHRRRRRGRARRGRPRLQAHARDGAPA